MLSVEHPDSSRQAPLPAPGHRTDPSQAAYPISFEFGEPGGAMSRPGWSRSSPVYDEPLQYRATVQSYSDGGYECVVRLVDRQKEADRFRLDGRRGVRHERPVEERNVEDLQRAAFRAKKNVRHKVKQIGADRMLTLTTRQQENTVDELLDRWQRWLKLVDKAGAGKFHYVAVAEPHPSNPQHFHLHIAIAVYLHIDVLRRCWWAVCGGRGMGNVHIKRFAVHGGPRRTARIASYISKYLTKNPTLRFNKKRYWSSRVSLPEVRRYWLKSSNLFEAFMELRSDFSFRYNDARDVWLDETRGVLWVQSLPGSNSPPPF